ncbi:MAG: TrmJ/YjtD family RNA methyltransferase [Gemmatimonadota bacterium]|nr:TrmJ/YjtD family RNA methyltransferase [Gemmatimonadota bacterium]
MTAGRAAGDESQLDRTVIVLHEPQDLVNIALVIRAMKNMGLYRLRLVRPAEFDPHRVTGIAHDTEDMVERVEFHDDLASALTGAEYVLGATARRRSTRQDWWTPEEAARELAGRSRRLAIVFGREDRGLSNEALDLCHGLVHIPTNPEHPSMNLAHAGLIVFYELRKAVLAAGDVPAPDLSHKRRQRTRPATHDELEAFFDTWQTAMEKIGLFHGIDPLPKMRSFRALFQRADLDRRELGLIEASAYEIIHFASREVERARKRLEAERSARDEPGSG